ncbi:hypothetical protein PD716_22125 [Vibrio gigantis]|uniref:hypothetical protein n=1 Tax=Vibrio gigantis TaxID=296199 RepID=UPI002FCA3654
MTKHFTAFSSLLLIISLTVFCLLYFPFNKETKSDVVFLPNSAPEIINDKISNNADYPIPIIKLQKLMITPEDEHVIVEPDINNQMNRLGDNHHARTIESLRLRLNQLQNDNH